MQDDARNSQQDHRLLYQQDHRDHRWEFHLWLIQTTVESVRWSRLDGRVSDFHLASQSDACPHWFPQAPQLIRQIIYGSLSGSLMECFRLLSQFNSSYEHFRGAVRLVPNFFVEISGISQIGTRFFWPFVTSKEFDANETEGVLICWTRVSAGQGTACMDPWTPFQGGVLHSMQDSSRCLITGLVWFGLLPFLWPLGPFVGPLHRHGWRSFADPKVRGAVIDPRFAPETPVSPGEAMQKTILSYAVSVKRGL